LGIFYIQPSHVTDICQRDIRNGLGGRNFYP